LAPLMLYCSHAHPDPHSFPTRRSSDLPADPMPRLANGTPNLGRVAGEKGIWGVPWIRNMALRIDNTDAISDLPRSGGDAAEIRRDRKSTRLNSSHRTISYAVFCLKKKT